MRVLLVTLGALLLSDGALGQTTPSQSAAPPAREIPIDRFTRFDEFGTIKISPDGEYVAATTGKFGRSLIIFINLKDNKITSGIRCPDGFQIEGFHWVSATRIIYTLLERTPGIEAPSRTGEIFAVDRDGKKQEMLYGMRAGTKAVGTNLRGREATLGSAYLISTLKNDDRYILIAEYPWKMTAKNYYAFDPDVKPIIMRLDVYSGDKKKVTNVPLSEAGVLLDHNDQVRFVIGRDENFKVAVSWKPVADAPWTDFELPGFRDQSIEPQLFGADNESILFTAVRDTEEQTALYRLDLKTKAVTKIYGFERGGVSDVVLDFTGKEAIGVFGYGDKPVYHWLDKADRKAKVYTGLFQAFTGQDVTLTSATSDGRLAIVFVESDTNPGDYYLFDTQTMQATYLRSSREWIAPEDMQPKVPFSLTARDGLELHGYLTRPKGAAPYPLVVLPHGGPHSIRDYWEFESDVQLLASRGYAVLQLNFRGSGGYGDKFEQAGYRQWGARMQDDVTDATNWAIEKKIAAADRICIYGGSYGAYTALMGAVREPNLYRCAIGDAGIYDLELMLSTADISKSKNGRAYLELVLGSDRDSLHARSPVYQADRIQSPVLLIHGKEDWRADFEQAKRMKAALEKHRKAVEWVPLSREGHGAYDEDTRREVYERVLAFLDKHLKAPPQKAN